MKTIASILSVTILCFFISFLWNMCNNTGTVVKQEFAPAALLKKYEAFKDMSAAIDKKRADITLYEEQISQESDEFEKRQLKSELRGIISIYNQLCADYNSAMSKFNYKFTNKGDLPASNLEPLPREIKPYIISIKN